MRQSLMWFWQNGILSTSLAGLFALLPIPLNELERAQDRLVNTIKQE